MPTLPTPSRLAAVLLLCSTAALAQPAPATDPRGTWLTASGNLEVEIAACGDALCGTVTRVLGNRSMSGSGEAMQPVDPRPALGMQLLSEFRPLAGDAGGAPTAWEGRLYDRENGKTYRCRMSVSHSGQAAGELVLRPYIILPLFGKTLRWPRALPAARAAAAASAAH